MNWGAFILDPLNLAGFQNEPQRPMPPPAQPTPPSPPPLSLDLSNPSPYGVTAGNEDGRPERGYFQPGSVPAMKPGQGFLGSMMGQESPFKPGWAYAQGKGPQWVTKDGPEKSGTPFTGNRI